MRSKKIRYAVIGLGHIAQVAVLPGFAKAENSELVSLISHDKKKLKVLCKKYGLKEEDCYEFGQFPDCLQKSNIDVLYVATPNDTHCDIVCKALPSGVHVLCEKPLALSEEECDKMIDCSEANNRLLMTAYRLHFEQSNLQILQMIKDKKIGNPQIFNSVFTMQIKDKNNIRLNPTVLGGGPIWDIGIYCLNACRAIFKSEPYEVMAMENTSGDSRFSSTHEMMSVMLRFPDNRVANFTCGFSSDSCASYDVIGTKGRIHLDKAFEYASERTLTLLEDDSVAKRTNYQKNDQFAAELVYFSNCVLNDKTPEPSGFEGRADVRIIEAILHSARNKTSVTLHTNGHDVAYPSPSQIIRKRGQKESPETIHAKAPGGD